jgi:hypothetical protein
MASNVPCLTNDRINDVIFEAEQKALEELLQNPKWDPTQTSREIVDMTESEEALFKKVQEVVQRSYRMAKGTYAGGSRKSKKSSRSRNKSKSRRARS